MFSPPARPTHRAPGRAVVNYRGIAAPAARGVGGAAVLGAITVTGSFVAVPESEAITTSQAGTLTGTLPTAPTEKMTAEAEVATYSSMVLRHGARGDAISYLQARLNDRGADIAVDGTYGPSTLKAVKAVQKNGGVSADGVVGPQTWNILVNFSAEEAPAYLPPSKKSSAKAPTSTKDPSWASKVMRPGQKGKGISYLQSRLNDRGAGIAVDGSFGPATLRAVKAVQKNGGVTADGVVGPKTWNILVNTSAQEAPAYVGKDSSPSKPSKYTSQTLRYGDRGDAVKHLQKGLRDRGADISADGKFGPGTRSAVKALQNSGGIRADGVVGSKTWKLLTDSDASAEGSGGSSSSAWPGKSMVSMAKDQIGVKYRWGGEDPATGLDCSGLVRYVYSQHGISVPRVAKNQVYGGRIIPQSEAKAGDLVAFSGGNWGHIGIYDGNGKIIDASGSRQEVLHRSIWNSPHVFVTYR